MLTISTRRRSTCWVTRWNSEARPLPDRYTLRTQSEALSRVLCRKALIDSRFSTIICAPVDSARHGLAAQVDIGIDEGLRHGSSVHCDELFGLQESQLTQFVGSLAAVKLRSLERALALAPGVAPTDSSSR